MLIPKPGAIDLPPHEYPEDWEIALDVPEPMQDAVRKCPHTNSGYNAFGWGCSDCGLGASAAMQRQDDGTYLPRTS